MYTYRKTLSDVREIIRWRHGLPDSVRKVGNNRFVYLADTPTGYEVRYLLHQTDILTLKQDQGDLVVAVNTNGWNTVTTFAALKDAFSHFNLPFQVYYRRGKEYKRKDSIPPALILTNTRTGEEIVGEAEWVEARKPFQVTDSHMLALAAFNPKVAE